ncbi:MAG: helix-turn-helix transcriptional regulator [Tannerellaceae bacterium]|jgi:AraC-like DNA-binding protein|nr:helix-turn-helix transcriptional regulator [Tannerellaceae bacterium]
MINSLYFEEQLSCTNDAQSGFRYVETEEDRVISFQQNDLHHLIFILEGSVIANCNEFKNHLIGQSEFAFFPKLSGSFVKTCSPCKIIVFSFFALKTSSEKQAFQSYWRLFPNINYTFNTLPFRTPLIEFFELLVLYLQKNVNCAQLHEIKHQELFLILHTQYPKEDLAGLFYPIIGKSFDFRSLILENYLKIHHIDELAHLSGMGRTNFDNKFKEEFGISPHQWILKQKAKHVRNSLAEPDATFSDVMRKYNFNSATHFTRFCKQQFGCTPTELVRQLHQGDGNIHAYSQLHLQTQNK